MMRDAMKPDGNDGSADVRACALAFIDALKSTPLVHHYKAETNAIISKILGIDFGQTAGRAGGAC
jgi:hypothetical protein